MAFNFPSSSHGEASGEEKLNFEEVKEVDERLLLGGKTRRIQVSGRVSGIDVGRQRQVPRLVDSSNCPERIVNFHKTSISTSIGG
jgi:hypothetical protein